MLLLSDAVSLFCSRRELSDVSDRSQLRALIRSVFGNVGRFASKFRWLRAIRFEAGGRSTGIKERRAYCALRC